MKRKNPIEFARTERLAANEFAQAMWQHLRNRQRLNFKFRREQPLGPYTADFFCAEAKIVVEVDGKRHLTTEGVEYDRNRDRWMESQGIQVLRFYGFEIQEDIEEVLLKIEQALAGRASGS